VAERVKTVTMTSKGQVTLSSAARKQLGVDKGATFMEVVVGNCVILMVQNEIAAEIRQRAQQALINAGTTVDELKDEICGVRF
jgi:bifunctional DNA-binding transcriptional regulator/antitoxin component of YhaV-PrlF toxin-antitoxin module